MAETRNNIIKIIKSELSQLLSSNTNYIEANKETIKFIINMITDSNHYKKFIDYIEQITRSNTSYNNGEQINISSSLLSRADKEKSDLRDFIGPVEEESKILDKDYEDYFGQDTFSILIILKFFFCRTIK